jgi:outer membrane protein assembly factor BamB
VLVALAPDDGTLLWRINADQGARLLLATGASVIGFVPLDPYYAYIGALAAGDGHELWRQKTGTTTDALRGLRHGNTLYTITGGALTALAVADGAKVWSYPLASLDPELKPPYYFNLAAIIS